MKKIAILLNGSLDNDNRVKKTISTLLKEYEVHIFTAKKSLEIEKINFFQYNKETRPSFRLKVIQHSFFWNEFNYLYQEVLDCRINFDFIWANDLPTLKPAAKVAKKLDAKLIYDAHEIYIETLNQFFPRNSKGLKNFIFQSCLKFMKYFGKRIESNFIKKVDYFITVNNSLLNYFEKQYQIPSSLVLMNIPEKSKIELHPINFNKKYGWNTNSFICIYQGALNQGRGLEVLIDSFSKLEEKFKLVIVGDGSLKSRLIEKVKLKKLTKKIRFTGLVDLENYPKYALGADLGINLLEDYNLSKKLASPNKLFEYIYSKIPVLCSFSPENNQVFKKFNIGCQTNINAQEISEAITMIASLPDASIEKIKNELEEAEKFYVWNKNDLLSFLG